jgi:amino acid permease
MDSEKRQVDNASTFSHKEEIKIETLTDENDRITTSSLESQEEPRLKRSLKARHLAASIKDAINYFFLKTHILYIYR